MSKWQGIGMAVDAHLARLGMANRGIDTVRDILGLRNGNTKPKFTDDIPDDLMRRQLSNEWGMRWTMFGASYGHVGEDGKPQITLGIQEGQTVSGREQFNADVAAVSQGAFLGLREQRMLDLATTHYVSGNVIDEITEAASLIGPEPIFDTDLFVPHGFAVFEHPIVMPDLDPDTGRTHPTIKTHIRAMGWTRENAIFNQKSQTWQPGVSLFLYTSREDYHEGHWRTSLAAGFEPYPAEEVIADRLVPVEVIPWSFNVDWQGRDEAAYVPGTVPMPIAQERRWFLSFMRLCWQEIIVRRAHRAPRYEARRWERLGKRKALLDYSVLRLRREVDPNYHPPRERTGTLDYRQHVRGTWKRVHYSSLGPARLPDGRMDPATHRRKWVEAYWRGPEDGEEGPTHKATSVTR